MLQCGSSAYNLVVDAEVNMPSARRWIPILATGLAVALMPAGSSAAEKDGMSPATRQLLREQKLQKLARHDAPEAIRELDRWRLAGNPEGIGTAIAEVALAAARKAPSGDAKGLFLCAAAANWPEVLEQAAGEVGSALELYDEAVEGLIDALQETRSAALRGGTDEIEGPLARYNLSWVDAGPEWTPATHAFQPTSGIRPKKNPLEDRQGLGTPVLAIERAEDEEDEPEREEGLFEIYKYYYPLTAVLELSAGEGDQPRSVVLRLLDPRLAESHEIAGNEYPLSIDIGAQFLALEQETDAIFAKKGVLKSGKYLSLTSLYLSEPLRPGKIPLVLTHGLASSPTTWAASVSEFMLDPTIRQSYQVWFFAYPTGVAFPYTASLLRTSLLEAMERLDEVGANPASDRVVMMGHSMGGLLTRMQVTDTGMTLWDAVFSEPPEEIDMPAEDVDELIHILVVEPLPFVERAVFCSTPHRGSKYAANSAGKLGASLVRLPKETLDFSRRIALSGGDAFTDEAAQYKKVPDSVQTLQPKNPLLVALDTLPVDPRVSYHLLIGDRGKGDTPDSSDGVVPYWSSHLDGAASEKIVPSGHSTQWHPEGVEELQRILLLHLEEGEP